MPFPWRKTKKILLGAVGVLLLAAALVYATLIAATDAPQSCTYDLDLAKLRALAASIPGERPAEIRVESVAGSDLPRAIACAGAPWSKTPFRVYSYQLVYPDRTIIVDTAMDASQAKGLDMIDGYDEAAWRRVAKGLSEASAVYVTHEHADHMGGAFANDKWAGRLRLTPRQLDSEAPNRPVISAAARAAAQTVAYDGARAVAPGVVLIEARGHTPGSQMVFVARADGTEVLLTGDTAWIMDNVEREQGPAKFVTLIMHTDRNLLECQLAAIDRIRESDERVAIMPGHDKRSMDALVEKGVFVRGFK